MGNEEVKDDEAGTRSSALLFPLAPTNLAELRLKHLDWRFGCYSYGDNPPTPPT
jgi:hypothetical protein